MSFRNLITQVPTEHDCAKLVVFSDDKFVSANLDTSLPSSNDYNLADLLASGQRVVPVDTSILHDTHATSQLVTNLANSDANNSTNNYPTDNIL